MGRSIGVVSVLLLMLGTSSESFAYPWMIRHGYTACANCHTDPSGGGLLTRYGRAQAAILLSTPWADSLNEEPGRYKDFLFGAMELPEAIDAQAWLRSGYMATYSGSKLVDDRLLFMRGDVGSHIRLGAFRASGTLGIATKDSARLAQQAWVTSNESGANLVSREFWLGYSALDDALLVRAGRMNLPFGLRNIEHTSWVRSQTHTDTNQQQQYGVSVAYNSENIRGELMGIVGNYQLSPDMYRERGYSGYAEYAVTPRYAVGVSGLFTHAEADISTGAPTNRQAYGLFARASPIKPLVLLAETDFTVRSPKGSESKVGNVSLLQADFELIQGLHTLMTGELLIPGGSEAASPRLWLSLWWFAVAHLDARFDVIHRLASEGPSSTSLLFQLHAYL